VDLNLNGDRAKTWQEAMEVYRLYTPVEALIPSYGLAEQWGGIPGDLLDILRL